MSLVLTVSLALVQARRLRDFGRSGWWALGATLLPLIALLAVLFTRLEDLIAIIGIGIELVLVTLIGVVRGDTLENRFGLPPPFTLRRILTGR